MAERNEHTTRINYQHDDTQLRQATQGMQQHARQTDQAGDAAKRSTRQHQQQSGALQQQTGVVGRLAGGVQGMVSSWLGFTAITGLVVAGLRKIREESERTLKNIVDLGNELRDLSVNMGPLTDEAMRRIDATAETKEQRTALIGMASTLTSRRPDLAEDVDALHERLQRAAPLQRVTGASGADLADTTLALEAVGFDRPEDAAATLMTGGFQAGDIQRMAQRGGRETLELAMAASRASDIDPRMAGRSMPQVLRALDQRDDAGDLTEQLRAIGISDGMSVEDRILTAGRAMSGDDRGQRALARNALGDTADQFVPALIAGIESGELDQVRHDLATTTAAGLEDRMLQSEHQQRAQAQGARDLRRQRTGERADIAERAEREDEARTRLDEDIAHRTGAERVITRTGFEALTSVGVGPDVSRGIAEGGVFAMLRRLQETDEDAVPGGGGGTTVINHNNVRYQYNGREDQATADLEGPAVRP